MGMKWEGTEKIGERKERETASREAWERDEPLDFRTSYDCFSLRYSSRVVVFIDRLVPLTQHVTVSEDRL